MDNDKGVADATAGRATCAAVPSATLLTCAANGSGAAVDECETTAATAAASPSCGMIAPLRAKNERIFPSARSMRLAAAASEMPVAALTSVMLRPSRYRNVTIARSRSRKRASA